MWYVLGATHNNHLPVTEIFSTQEFCSLGILAPFIASKAQFLDAHSVMSRDRFKFLKSFLRFDNKDVRVYQENGQLVDKFVHLREVMRREKFFKLNFLDF